MKKTKILYVYGYNQFPDTCQIKNEIEKILGKRYDIICDYYAQYNPKEALIDIENYIKKNNIDILIGENIGGYLIMLMNNDIPKIIVDNIDNPIEFLESQEAAQHILDYYKEYENAIIHNINCYKLDDYKDIKNKIKEIK